MSPADSPHRDGRSGPPSALRVLVYVVAAVVVSIVLMAYPILIPSAIAAVVVRIFLRERQAPVIVDGGVIDDELTDENLSRAMQTWARRQSRPPM